MALNLVEKETRQLYDEEGTPVLILEAAVEKEAAMLMEKSSNVLMKAAKIKGLMDKDKIENPNKWKVAPNIIFTDDLAALEVMREIEDTEFEDVRTDGGETEEGASKTDSTKG